MGRDPQQMGEPAVAEALMAENGDPFLRGIDDPVNTGTFPAVAVPFQKFVGGGADPLVAVLQIQQLDALRLLPVGDTQIFVTVLQKLIVWLVKDPAPTTVWKLH